MSLVFHVAKRAGECFCVSGTGHSTPQTSRKNDAGILAGDLEFRLADEILLRWKLGLTECAETWEVDFISIANHCGWENGLGCR